MTGPVFAACPDCKQLIRRLTLDDRDGRDGRGIVVDVDPRQSIHGTITVTSLATRTAVDTGQPGPGRWRRHSDTCPSPAANP